MKVDIRCDECDKPKVLMSVLNKYARIMAGGGAFRWAWNKDEVAATALVVKEGCKCSRLSLRPIV